MKDTGLTKFRQLRSGKQSFCTIPSLGYVDLPAELYLYFLTSLMLTKTFLLLLVLITGSSLCGQPTSPLMAAIRNNDLPQAAQLVNNQTDLNYSDSVGDNALMYAALYSTVDCMKMLLQKGAKPNVKNNLGETALMWCTQDYNKVKLLLEHKADPNIKTDDGNTAFFVSCVGANQTPVIRLMLDHGADPLVINSRKETTLINLVSFGDTADARILLRRGVNINAKGRDGQSALFYAIKADNKEMIGWLLDNGADANLLDDYKANALGYAATIGDINIVKRMIALTKGINDPDTEGATTLMWALYSEHDNPDIIQALLDAGANPTLKDKKGQSTLDWALKKGNTASAELIKRSLAKK